MTDEDRLLLNDFKANIKQLFQEFDSLEKEKNLLENNIATLKAELKLAEHEKSELSRKNEQLKMANRILSGKDENREAKQKINRLIREIDKCIALLNK